MNKFIHKHRRILGPLAALAAFVVAAIYYVVAPEEASQGGFLQRTILAYGHSLCWILLGVASVLWGYDRTQKVSGHVAYAGLAVYIVFITTLFAAKLL